MGKPHVIQQQQQSADQEVLVQVNQFLLLRKKERSHGKVVE